MKLQTIDTKNIAKFTAALFALVLLFPCCMDSGSSGDSGDYDSGNSTENNDNWENPDDNNNTDDNTGDDSTKPDEPKPDTPDDSETTTEIDSNTDMSTLVATKKYIFKATGGTVDASKLVLAKKLFGDKLTGLADTNVNYILDFSNKSFANTTDEIESRSEYASKKGLTSSTSIITDENLTETIKIGDVEFITKPIYYNGDDDKVIQQAFKFGKKVDNVKVIFGNSHSMTEAYKGGIILENLNAKITSDNVNSATLTGYVYTETMNGLSDNSLMSKLAKDSEFLPTLNFDFVFLSGNKNFYGIGVDKILKNYYNQGVIDKISVGKASNVPFDAEEYLGGEYMYNTNGSYNSNAYNLDINIALLMAKKLTNNLKNVNVSGNLTSDVETSIIPKNVRFSGDVSGLTFTKQGNYGIIDFAGVGPKEIVAPSSKIIVNGVKNDTNTKIIAGRVVDFSGVDELKYLDASSSYVRTIYTKSGSFSGTQHVDTTFKTGSSASTNRAWEEAGRNGTLPSDSLSKLDVKAKANNPLLQKLLDENCPVYG
ncbi:hypothetical protein [uncultured Treponema sp.]|uniref:hypothetical protein n=1 Tax=uncultured Treponema sp. TaxID=162155 RepID=UPI0025CC3201|nr:hypothetical protein [uncultured Treponema sp.]